MLWEHLLLLQSTGFNIPAHLGMVSYTEKPSVKRAPLASIFCFRLLDSVPVHTEDYYLGQ